MGERQAGAGVRVGGGGPALEPPEMTGPPTPSDGLIGLTLGWFEATKSVEIGYSSNRGKGPGSRSLSPAGAPGACSAHAVRSASPGLSLPPALPLPFDDLCPTSVTRSLGRSLD